MADMLIVGSKVKAFIKEKGCKTAGDTMEALSACVARCLDKAVERARANKRATVKPQDL